jgi:triosephosphate isomerase
MNGSRAQNQALIAGLKAGMAGVTAEVVVCPPAVYLADVAAVLEGSAIGLGGQDLSYHAEGAYTGDISASMLRDVQAQYVIVGHSERREYHGESNDLVALKCHAALEAGLTPILCVGETLQERETGKMESVIADQVKAVVAQLGIAAMAKLVIAYEPIWAIGTGKTATPAQAQEVHAFIRGLLAAADSAVAQKVNVLYGGSVKADNAAELFAMPDIDGGLVGGASLEADSFIQICKAAV